MFVPSFCAHALGVSCGAVYAPVLSSALAAVVVFFSSLFSTSEFYEDPERDDITTLSAGTIGARCVAYEAARHCSSKQRFYARCSVQ